MPDSGGLVLAAGHELPEPLAEVLREGLPDVGGRTRHVRRGAPNARRLGRARRRSLRGGLARPRPRGRLSLAPGDPDRGAETRAGWDCARLLRRAADADGRGARARAAPRRRSPRGARAERAVRDRAQLARALAAAGADGRPARDRARPVGDPRRGGRTGARAARGRCGLGAPARGRQPRRQCRER